jgi:hypothetical protein
MSTAVDNPILEAALAYGRLGIKILPMHGIVDGRCTCGAPKCKSPGKHPATPRGSIDATDDLETISVWFRGDMRNIAIMPAVSNLVAIDVDPQNGGDVSTLPDWIFETPWERTGGGGYHFYLRSEKDTKYKFILSKGIEVKYHNLVNCAPSRHISGALYEWGRRILEYAPLEAPQWLIDGTAKVNRDEAVEQRLEILDKDTINDIKNILRKYKPDDYNTWSRVGMALRGVDGGFDIWHEWSKSSVKYVDKLDCLRNWRYYKPYSPGSGMLTWRSIPHILGVSGEDNPKDGIIDGIIAESLSSTEASSSLRRVSDPDDFPVRCLAEMEDSINISSKIARQIIVLTACSIASGRNYTVDSEQLIIYHLLSLDELSVFGEIVNSLYAILDNMDQDGIQARYVHRDRIQSDSDFNARVKKLYKFVHTPSDITQYFKLSGRQTSGALSSTIGSFIDMHGSPPKLMGFEIPKKDRKGNEEPIVDVYNPFVCLMAGMPSADVNASIKNQLTRLCMIATIKGHVKTAKVGDFPDSYIERYCMVSSALSGRNEVPSLRYETIRVTFPEEISFSFDACENEMTSSYVARKNYRRLCGILATFDNPERPVVSYAMADWAWRYVTARTNDSANVMSAADDESSQSTYDSILSFVRKAGPDGLKHSDLIRVCKKYRNLDKVRRDEVISRMHEDCVIHIEIGPKGGMTIYEGRSKQ